MIKRMVLRAVKQRFIDLYSLATETITLCPEETIDIPKAIYLDGALDKITGISIWRNWQQENELIYGGKIVAPPTLGYRINNIDVAGAFLYKDAAKSRAGYGPEKIFMEGHCEKQTIKKANLVTSYAGSLFFGPLLVDDFLLELNAQNHDENIRLVTRPYPQEMAYRNMLGLDKSALIQYAHLNQITLYSQPAINSLRTSQYRQLRQRMWDQLTEGDKEPKFGVYLKRGNTGEQRILCNEEEVEQKLIKLGFDIVEPSNLSVDEIARKTCNAKIVVSVEGSHKSHAIFSMADDGAFVVLQPPDRFSMVYKEFADCMGMKFSILIGDKVHGGFTVDTDDLQRIIEMVHS